MILFHAHRNWRPTKELASYIEKSHPVFRNELGVILFNPKQRYPVGLVPAFYLTKDTNACKTDQLDMARGMQDHGWSRNRGSCARVLLAIKKIRILSYLGDHIGYVVLFCTNVRPLKRLELHLWSLIGVQAFKKIRNSRSFHASQCNACTCLLISCAHTHMSTHLPTQPALDMCFPKACEDQYVLETCSHIQPCSAMVVSSSSRSSLDTKAWYALLCALEIPHCMMQFVTYARCSCTCISNISKVFPHGY